MFIYKYILSHIISILEHKQIKKQKNYQLRSKKAFNKFFFSSAGFTNICFFFYGVNYMFEFFLFSTLSFFIIFLKFTFFTGLSLSFTIVDVTIRGLSLRYIIIFLKGLRYFYMHLLYFYCSVSGIDDIYTYAVAYIDFWVVLIGHLP